LLFFPPPTLPIKKKAPIISISNAKTITQVQTNKTHIQKAAVLSQIRNSGEGQKRSIDNPSKRTIKKKPKKKKPSTPSKKRQPPLKKIKKTNPPPSQLLF
jgi:hypothetical protein